VRRDTDRNWQLLLTAARPRTRDEVLPPRLAARPQLHLCPHPHWSSLHLMVSNSDVDSNFIIQDTSTSRWIISTRRRSPSATRCALTIAITMLGTPCLVVALWSQHDVDWMVDDRYGLGQILFRQQKFGGAEVHYRKGLQINPSNSALYCHAGMVSSPLLTSSPSPPPLPFAPPIFYSPSHCMFIFVLHSPSHVIFISNIFLLL